MIHPEMDRPILIIIIEAFYKCGKVRMKLRRHDLCKKKEEWRVTEVEKLTPI